MTPTYHAFPASHDEHLETILFQCENVLGFGLMAKDAKNPQRRAEALDALKRKARCLLAALEDAHLERVDNNTRLAIPFPVGEKVRIHNARHPGSVGQVIALRATRVLGNVDVQLSTGGIIPAHNCDLEKA